MPEMCGIFVICSGVATRGQEDGVLPRNTVKQLGGQKALFRPEVQSGEQLGGVEACFRPRNVSCSGQRHRKNSLAGHEAHSGQRGTSKFAMPCYKTTFWRRCMAQVRKIAGDPRPEKIAPAP